MPKPNQDSVDSLVAKVQSETEAMTTETAQAIEGAARTASEIAGDIKNVPPPAGPPIGQPLAESPPETAPAEAQMNPDADISALLATHDVHRLLAIEVPVIVQLGTRRMTVAEVMRFSVGAIIEFNKSAEEELELLANNKAIGKGQAVKVGENFGIKISTIGSVKETIRKLGAA